MLISGLSWQSLPSNARAVGSNLVGKPRSHVLQGQKTKTRNGSNIVKNSIKTLKTVHIKENLFKKTMLISSKDILIDTPIINV